MGYAIAFGECIGCGKLFGFNPLQVPSSSAVTGQREPICRDCVERINLMRIRAGVEPIVPLPGAYDPIEEGEL